MNDRSRREVLKLLSLSSLALVVPSCITSTEKPESSKEKNIEPEVIPELTVEDLENELDRLGVLILTPTDSDFESYYEHFNLNIDKKPAYIAVPNNTEGVQIAVQFAKAKGLKLSVKSGGHSFEGFSLIEGGLMVSLVLMNELKWGENHELIAQPAVLLKHLYDFILPKNRLLPAGSCGTVGLAGLTLGGGYGFFSREYGLSCDQLIHVTLVDEAGSVHEIDESHELMWALRGGGNGNFGIVTELIYRTVEAPFSFTRYRLQAKLLDVIRAKSLMNTWFSGSKQLTNNSFSAFVLNGTTLTVLITYFGKTTDAIEAFLESLKPVMDKVSIGEATTLEDALPTYYGTQHPIYFKNASAGYYHGIEDIEDVLDQIIPEVMSSKLIYQINTLGGKIHSPQFEKQSVYPHRNMPYLSELQSYWKKESQKDQKVKSFDKIQDILQDHGIDKQYRNYPNIKFKHWEKAYYGTSYEKLSQLKAKYDPHLQFDYEQGVKP